MQSLLKRKAFNNWVIFSGIVFSDGVFADAVAAESDYYALPVHYSGRLLLEKNEELTTYTYSWPGVYFEAEFTGSELDVRLNDANNILSLIIDDKEPIVLTRPGKIIHSLKNLSKGPHKVRLEKRTESPMATGTFEGFYVAAKAAVLQPEPRQRKIEYIGDSFSVGYANLSVNRQCNDEQIISTTNTHQAFGALTAKHFNADYQINAISGSGVVRNYNGAFPDENFRRFYPYTFVGNKTIKYANVWSPNIIVLELGGNDFATPLNPGEKWKNREELQQDFVKSYTSFILGLRKQHPQASLVLLVPHAPSDEMLQQHHKVVEQLKSNAQTRVHLLKLEPMELTACQWHPSAKDHQAVSQQLVDFISSNPELWQGK